MERRYIAAPLLLSIAAAPAVAQENEGFYIGAGIGDFSANIDGIEQIDEVDVDFDSDQDATRLFGGWRFNRFISVNVDYTDFGETAATTTLLPVTADTRGLAPSVIGTLPLGPIEIFGKAGVMFYDVDIDTPDDSLIDSSGEDAVLGVGIGGTIMDDLSLTLEYEEIDIDELDEADAVWLTASWRF